MVATPVAPFDLDAYALPRRQLVETTLDEYVQISAPELLWEAMRYSLLSKGKRFRALLCLAGAEAVEPVTTIEGGLKAQDVALPCACAIEMIHAMSLIHDDLPCMDNDDFRRGMPTNHKQFGEAMALLAGDALLVLSTEVLLAKTPSQVSRQALLLTAREMAAAAGARGMVGGQVADSIATGLVAQKQEQPSKPGSDAPTAELLESIHKRKTGALLRFSAWSGAGLLCADQKILDCLASFGEILGLAFQIADDLLDQTGDLKSLGKTPGKDQAAGKLTWVSVYGIEGSAKAVADLKDKAESLLSGSGLPEQSIAPLKALLSYAIHRQS